MMKNEFASFFFSFLLCRYSLFVCNTRDSLFFFLLSFLWGVGWQFCNYFFFSNNENERNNDVPLIHASSSSILSYVWLDVKWGPKKSLSISLNCFGWREMEGWLRICLYAFKSLGGLVGGGGKGEWGVGRTE